MPKGKYPDKWAKNKYDTRSSRPAPHSPANDKPEQKPLTGPDAESRPEPAPKTTPKPIDKPLYEREKRVVKAPPVAPSGKEPLQMICGKNAVLAALRSGQSVNRVLMAEGLTGSFATEVIKRCRDAGVPFQFVPKARLALLAGPDHRGVACELCAVDYAEIEDMLALARERNEQPLLVLLDGVEDPHNLGAVIRTALCVGAHGLIIPKRRAVALTATVAKTSAGASAYLPVARVANLNQTARDLKEAGLWLAAADMDGQTAWQANLNLPLALVLGGEDKGVSSLLKQHCDLCISLPMGGPLGSLNVSAAAAALLYEIRRQRAY